MLNGLPHQDCTPTSHFRRLKLTVALRSAMMAVVRVSIIVSTLPPPDLLMPKRNHAPKTSSPGAALAHDLVHQIDDLLQDAAGTGKPIEIDPHRTRLFEFFVLAEAAGFLEEGSAQDLSCDAIARELAARWDLAKNLGGGIPQPANLPPEQLGRLRLLWSFMRMWMEWSYAWQRWDEFHKQPAAQKSRVAR